MNDLLLAITAISILFAWLYSMRQKDDLMKQQYEQWQAEREEWAVERQRLIDRIQAPSFAEYKHAEVKTFKAQQGIKEPPPLEVM